MSIKVFKKILPRIQKLQRRVGATSMKVRKMERKMMELSSFKHRSSGWRERTQTF